MHVVDVRNLAAEIVKKWKEVVSRRGRPDAVPKPDIPSKRKKAESKKEDSPDSDQASAIKKRRSTVKMPPTVMRTAGIEEASEPLPLKSRSEVLAKKRYVLYFCSRLC